MRERHRERCDDVIGLNIWWNLNCTEGFVRRDSFLSVNFFPAHFFAIYRLLGARFLSCGGFEFLPMRTDRAYLALPPVGL